eukprot:CAMPEP_0119555718 /NCGR_PEP_ID=MMETSP1352-20130426/7844_1 /TAXON_ID=265584 /ORGANISM="Stauroneis constricta, Strain CCMP1120" /LENGTH=105 /DNA_ID=CAMNT_0007602529 /DNA_START=250 /DNA_END=563 /DNA_ORIENTATION=+
MLLLTWEVMKLMFSKAFVKPRKLFEMISILSFCISFIFGIQIIVGKKNGTTSMNFGLVMKSDNDNDENEIMEEIRLGEEVAIDDQSSCVTTTQWNGSGDDASPGT